LPWVFVRIRPSIGADAVIATYVGRGHAVLGIERRTVASVRPVGARKHQARRADILPLSGSTTSAHPMCGATEGRDAGAGLHPRTPGVDRGVGAPRHSSTACNSSSPLAFRSQYWPCFACAHALLRVLTRVVTPRFAAPVTRRSSRSSRDVLVERSSCDPLNRRRPAGVRHPARCLTDGRRRVLSRLARRPSRVQGT
jgi:hypothetical protein